MPSAPYKLVVSAPDVRASLTPEDVRKAALPFRRGHSNGTPYEELVLDISGKLRQSVGPIRRDNKDIIEDIAVLVKMLTMNRTFPEARAYIKEAGNTWLRQWLVPKVRVSTVTTVDAPTTRTPVNPIIAVAEVDGEIATPVQQVDMTTEVLATPLERLRAVPGPVSPGNLEAPASPIGLLPGSPRRSSAHSRSSSDVSTEFNPERCPRCRQYHTEVIMLCMAQFLMQHGVGLDEDRAQVGSSHRQLRRGHGTRASSSVGTIPGSPGSTTEHHPPVSIEGSSLLRASGPGLPIWFTVWLMVLSVSVVVIVIWLASK